MRHRRIVLFVLLMAWVVAGAEPLVAQAPPRLIADNRTPYVVEIYVATGGGWSFVSRLNGRTWTAFPNAVQGSRWRAMIGQVARDHVVQYYYDPNYGGYQSVWIIQ